MTIDAIALPRPATVEMEDGTVLRLSAWGGGAILKQDRPDTALRPRLVTLVYATGTHRSKLHAVREHYRQHHGSDFDWQLPGDAYVRRWIYREPTTVAFDTAVSGSARAFLEEALAHD